MKSLSGLNVLLSVLACAISESPDDGQSNGNISPLTEIGEAINPAQFFNAENDVTFLLYTQRNYGNGQILSLDANAIRNTLFNSNAPTRLVIHGWNSDGNSPVIILIKSAYLNRGDFNVIIVDWGKGANTVDYGAARNNIFGVASVTADLLNYLITNGFTNHSQVLIAGHSLGAHAAGITGKLTKKVSGGKVQSIVGLDPAGPLFSLDMPDERIASDDANYVEIIHTNGWSLGFGEPLGQADFFPNYGRFQPGCAFDFFGTCSHGRAADLFAESINSNQFIAVECASFDEVNNGRCAVQSSGYLMGGEPPNNGLRGYFYLSTNSYSPFGRSYKGT